MSRQDFSSVTPARKEEFMNGKWPITAPPLIIASANSEKSRELKQHFESAFKGSQFFTTLFDKTFFKDDEAKNTLLIQLSCLSASTPAELALKKARLIAETSSSFAIAEETLLVIPRLGDERTAFTEKTLLQHSQDRYEASASASFLLQQTKKLPDTRRLLEKMTRFDDTISRSACLISFLAFSSPCGKEAYVTSSQLEGYIAESEKGSKNFEFGSIFIKHEYSKTLSELPPSVYIRISHRRKAVEKIAPVLEKAIMKLKRDRL